MLYGLGAMGLVTTIFTYHHAVWLGCYGIGHYHLHLSPCCMAWVLWDWSLPSSLITMLYGLGAMGLVTTIFSITMLYGLGAMGLVTTIFTYHHAVWLGCYGIGHYNLNLSPCCMVWVLWDWSLPSSVSPCCMVWVLWDWSPPSSHITMLYGLGAMGLVTTIFTYHHAVWLGCYGIGHYHLQYHHAVWFGCYGIGHYHLHLSPCCMVWML